jgi:hypothetical protein
MGPLAGWGGLALRASEVLPTKPTGLSVLHSYSFSVTGTIWMIVGKRAGWAPRLGFG